MDNLKLQLGKINERHVRLGLAIVALVLFVVGAGAPSGGAH